MVSLAFVISFVVSAVVMVIGIVIFSDIVDELGNTIPQLDVDSSQILGQNTATSDQLIPASTTNLASIYTGLNPADSVTKVEIPISDVTVGQRSLDVSTEDNKPQGLTFKPDGSRMFMVGLESATVYQYDLGILYDVETATLSSTFDVSTEDTNPQNITFRPDGTMMFMIGEQSNKLHEYNLGTPFDISTSINGIETGFNVVDTNVRGVAFTPDGLRMFIVGNQFDTIYQYTLGTAWVITTKSLDTQFYVGDQETNPTSITIKTGGGSFFLIGGNFQVYQYDMTVYDINTSTFITSFPTNDSSTAIAFSPDGLQVFAVKGG